MNKKHLDRMRIMKGLPPIKEKVISKPAEPVRKFRSWNIPKVNKTYPPLTGTHFLGEEIKSSAWVLENPIVLNDGDKLGISFTIRLD